MEKLSFLFLHLNTLSERSFNDAITLGETGVFADGSQYPFYPYGVVKGGIVLARINNLGKLDPDFVPSYGMTAAPIPELDNSSQTLSQLLESKYTIDQTQEGQAKIRALAQDIQAANNHIIHNLNGFTYLQTPDGHKLVEVSPLGTRRFFDSNGNWIMSIDRYGQKSYELKWRSGIRPQLASALFSFSGRHYRLNNDIHGFSILEKVSENRPEVSIGHGEWLLDAPGSNFDIYKIFYAAESNPGLGVALINIMSTLAYDKGSQTVMTSVQVFSALEAVAKRMNDQGSSLVWKPVPLEIIFNPETHTSVFTVSVESHPISERVKRVMLNGAYFVPGRNSLEMALKDKRSGLFFTDTNLQERFSYILVKDGEILTRMDIVGQLDLSLPASSAMKAKVSDKGIEVKRSTGGIDLNPLDRAMTLRGSRDFSYTPRSLQNIRIKSLKAIVTGIEDLHSLSAFLGINSN